MVGEVNVGVHTADAPASSGFFVVLSATPLELLVIFLYGNTMLTSLLSVREVVGIIGSSY